MSADIDIDFADREKALSVLKHIRAAKHTDGKITPHNTGIYFQSIPVNPLTNLANVDYKEAESRGYFKVDFLNVSVYNNVRDEEHLVQLMSQEPMWELLQQDDFVNLLFHINGYGDVLRAVQPDSVEKLAAVLAMIRPAKRHLIGKDWSEIFAEVWVKPTTDEYYFKKSHSLAYAMAIVVQMNLICEGLS